MTFDAVQLPKALLDSGRTVASFYRWNGLSITAEAWL
jgi:hypothetical protein